MHTLVFFAAAAIGLAGMFLLVGDYAIETRFPALGPALIAIGVLLIGALYFLHKRER